MSTSTFSSYSSSLSWAPLHATSLLLHPVQFSFLAISVSVSGALESRVAGLHRLLFRMNALEFFSYRISWSLHFNTYDTKAYYAPKEDELRGKDGSLDPVQMTKLATRLLTRLLKNSTACGAIRYNLEAIGLLWPYLIECREEDTSTIDKKDGEEDEEEEEEEGDSVGISTRGGKRPCLSKEEICRRIFISPLTNAFFSVLADKQVRSHTGARNE